MCSVSAYCSSRKDSLSKVYIYRFVHCSPARSVTPTPNGSSAALHLMDGRAPWIGRIHLQILNFHMHEFETRQTGNLIVWGLCCQQTPGIYLKCKSSSLQSGGGTCSSPVQMFAAKQSRFCAQLAYPVAQE
jgi:hypothetical protein